MAKKVDHSQSSGLNICGERMVKIPLRINPETIEEDGFAGQVRYIKIGFKRWPCVIVQVPESSAKMYLRLEWSDVKCEERSNRCLVPDGRGGFVHCSEKNKCISCEKVRDFGFDSMLPTSLDALIEEADFDLEAPATDESNDDAANEMMSVLIQRLGELCPRYADIFREMLDGEDSPFRISKKLNLGKSQTYTDMEQVRKLAQHIYFELLGE